MSDLNRIAGFSAGGQPVYVAPVESDDLATRKQAMEQIIVASFRAGFEIGASREFRQTVEPVIEWDGLKPRITGYKVDA